MSNKDVRKPAPGAGAEFAKKHADAFAKARGASSPPDDGELDPDELYLSKLSKEEYDGWVVAGNSVKQNFEAYFVATDETVDTSDALRSLDVCVRFLTQLVELTSVVLQSVDVRSLREIVASELPVPREFRISLKAIGVDVEEFTAPAKKEDDGTDHRKRPRGQRHPLMVLIQMSIQATRLIQKITAGTNPDAQNLQTQEEKAEQRSKKSMFSIALPD